MTQPWGLFGAWWRRVARPIWRDLRWVAIGIAVLALGLGWWGSNAISTLPGSATR